MTGPSFNRGGNTMHEQRKHPIGGAFNLVSRHSNPSDTQPIINNNNNCSSQRPVMLTALG
eukprot:m.23335 g.23335  ORF g.23335 m.23335 type:complete len:60 (-) comp8485_c0_seq1:122-301(-)